MKLFLLSLIVSTQAQAAPQTPRVASDTGFFAANSLQTPLKQHGSEQAESFLRTQDSLVSIQRLTPAQNEIESKAVVNAEQATPQERACYARQYAEFITLMKDPWVQSAWREYNFSQLLTIMMTSKKMGGDLRHNPHIGFGGNTKGLDSLALQVEASLDQKGHCQVTSSAEITQWLKTQIAGETKPAKPTARSQEEKNQPSH